jgi:NAD-dependent dihydropyrimidine dehydrogenase PreA subunit
MAKNYIHIDSSQCKGCRLCVESCPKNCIAIGSTINEIGYQYAEYKNPQCIACGFCYYVCPEPGAITVYKDEEEES